MRARPRLREDILDTADRLLTETGDEEAVSIRAIAGAVGASAAAVYLHFADKADLLFAVCERHFSALDACCEEAAATSDDPLVSLQRRGEAYVRFGLAEPEHYRVLFMGRPSATPASWGADRLLGSAAFDHLAGAVARCVEAGAFRPVDPVLGAIGLWAAVHGITSLMVAKPDFPWPPVDELVAHVLGAHARGLSPD